MSVAIIGVVGLGLSVGLTAYGAVQKNKAAKKAAASDEQVAEYNASIDIAQAQQLQMDTEANVILAERRAKDYVSKQEVSYAASGVLATTGSPLHAQIATVGALNQQIQQDYSNSQRRQQLLYKQASQGIEAGGAMAGADRARGTAALLDAGASIAGMAFSAYRSGTFSGFGKGGGTPDEPVSSREMMQGG